MRPGTALQAALAGAALSAAVPAQASDKAWQRGSDIAVYSLMAIAVGAPLAEGDEAGALQAAGSLAASTLLSQGLKESFPKWRPDRSDRQSFPSGHSANGFAAAASLCNRHEARVCVPAFALAGLVALARVEGRKHFWIDAAAGAAIGTAAGFLITRKPGSRAVTVVPSANMRGVAIHFAMRF